MDRISAAPGQDETSSGAVTTARAAFGAWLRAEREAKGISLEEIARVTKIQIRALERLEDAQFDDLPADVFVRGFIRNYARVVGLDADAALSRYDDCGVTPGPAASTRAKAMIETMSELAPNAAKGVQSVVTRKLPTGPVALLSKPAAPPVQPAQPALEVRDDIGAIVASVPVPEDLAEGSLRMPIAPAIEVEPEPVVEAAPVVVEEEAPKKKGRKKRSGGKTRKSKKSEIVETVEAAAPVEAVIDSPSEGMEITILVDDPIVDPMQDQEAPPPVLVTPPRNVDLTRARPSKAPTLVIDDADPESAERLREARLSDDKADGKRSFLPSSVTRALLDSEKGHRGGLTLAVIILLIVATLTLSYLMRRPSSSGEGVTMTSQPTDVVA